MTVDGLGCVVITTYKSWERKTKGKRAGDGFGIAHATLAILEVLI